MLSINEVKRSRFSHLDNTFYVVALRE